jgi:hypothetical protein
MNKSHIITKKASDINKEVWLDQKAIEDHLEEFGRSVGNGKSLIDEIIFRGLQKRSPAKAHYCRDILNKSGRVQLPRGCNFN